jgi:hypothetical protein
MYHQQHPHVFVSCKERKKSNKKSIIYIELYNCVLLFTLTVVVIVGVSFEAFFEFFPLNNWTILIIDEGYSPMTEEFINGY